MRQPQELPTLIHPHHYNHTRFIELHLIYMTLSFTRQWTKDSFEWYHSICTSEEANIAGIHRLHGFQLWKSEKPASVLNINTIEFQISNPCLIHPGGNLMNILKYHTVILSKWAQFGNKQVTNVSCLKERKI